jgi:glucose/mannose-6-phosphate isomerase
MSLPEIIKHFPDAEKHNYTKELTTSLIKKIDVDNMQLLLTDYYKHLETAIKNASAITSKENSFNNIKKVLILGIGGSAMSGELLRCYLKYILGSKCPQIIICRGTEIPNNITAKTQVFCCSYSGNTQETLQALNKIKSLTQNISVCTSGGELEEIAIKENYELLKMPQGMMPRCAMFYSFFHLLYAMMRTTITTPKHLKEISKSINSILNKEYEESLNYSNINDQNITIILARLMQNKIPIIYTGAERLEAVNLRWRAQIQENANQVCFGNYFPELNHNEINGWMFPKNLINDFIIISMKDIEDPPELNSMINKSVQLLRNNKMEVIDVLVDGDNLLKRLIRLICIAD